MAEKTKMEDQKWTKEHARLTQAATQAEEEAEFLAQLTAEEALAHAQLARAFEVELDALVDTLQPVEKRGLRLVPPPDPPGWPDF